MGRKTSLAAAVFMAAICVSGASGIAYAARQSNPVDRVSNPEALDYSDVEIAPRDMDETFVRDGIVTDPRLFTRITPGLEQTQVQNLLGAPLRRNGQEWDYNFQLKMEQSGNYLVCQYKVVFDEQKLVRDTVWRRRQCQQLAGEQP